CLDFQSAASASASPRLGEAGWPPGWSAARAARPPPTRVSSCPSQVHGRRPWCVSPSPQEPWAMPRSRDLSPLPDRGVSMQLTTRPEGPLMSKRMVAMGLFLGVLGVNFMAGADELFKAQLTGDQEVPAVATDTTGRFEIL